MFWGNVLSPAAFWEMTEVRPLCYDWTDTVISVPERGGKVINGRSHCCAKRCVGMTYM